jgi:hypothetical protein
MSMLLSTVGSDHADVLARALAAAGLFVAIAAIVVNWWIWHRSRPRLKVRMRSEPDTDPMRTRLAVDVVSVGRLAVVVKSVGVRDHIVVPGTNVRPTSLLSLPVTPAAAELPVTLQPTEYLDANVSMDAIIDRWDADKELALVAWAETGDGRRFESRPLKVRTPHRSR